MKPDLTRILSEAENTDLRVELLSLLRMQAAAYTQGDSQSLYPVLAELRGQFRLIAETQRISAKNIF